MNKISTVGFALAGLGTALVLIRDDGQKSFHLTTNQFAGTFLFGAGIATIICSSMSK